MSAREPIAHSASGVGGEPDNYSRHVAAVRQGAVERAEEMLKYWSGADKGDLLEAIEAAATYHDIGKLDRDTQESLWKGRKARLAWDHIDAGVAYLSQQKNWMAAWLVRAHHSPGLPRKADHFGPGILRQLRGRRNDTEPPDRHTEQTERTNAGIVEWIRLHEQTMGRLEVSPCRPLHGLTMRLALSCLVDADHSDSARWERHQTVAVLPECRWQERLEALKHYVNKLPTGRIQDERDRNALRVSFFDSCLNSAIRANMASCEAPVGLGKTTSVTAYLLRRAAEDGLRRLIVVAPYTAILSQTARRLREALVLAGEKPDEIVVEHHHRADFSRLEDRDLAVLWQAPVVLTTAVSLFETLAACDPASLRKLHSVPGSAILIDEAHAALPATLWPQCWSWLRTLAEQWGCRVMFSSGTLVRFWEDDRVINPPSTIPELFVGSHVETAFHQERQRVRYQQLNGGRPVSPSEFVDAIQQHPGPRLVILNTVQNAAVVASKLRNIGADVLHISTALTPRDREQVLERVRRKLLFTCHADWALVATSCVESGVELSFRTAFRERFSTASSLQTAGRANRQGEYNELGGADVFDFVLEGEGATQHPNARISGGILLQLMEEDRLNRLTPTEVVTVAMREELRITAGVGRRAVTEAELERDYPTVKDLCRVIAADTRLVVVDPTLVQSLKSKTNVTFRQLLEGSVQIWAKRIESLALEALPGRRELYIWTDDYDPDFLGYMSGVLRNADFMKRCDWIV